ncbi:MAG: cytochrome c [Candidatus Latescibacterota bacterium]|jgi:sulfite dehydrogenase
MDKKVLDFKRFTSSAAASFGWGALFAGIALLMGCGSDAGVDAQLALGREVFMEEADPPCGTCHQLRDAGTEGKDGPNLDVLRPDSARVSVAIRYGVGIMPPQVGVLTDEEIAAVAGYVARISGGDH